MKDKDALDALSDALGYIHYNKAWIKNNNKLRIENVIFNGPATIVFWSDKTKTIIKCSSEEQRFDEEKGLAMAILKKIWEVSGMEGSYYRQIFKKWIKEEEEPLSLNLVAEYFKKATECNRELVKKLKEKENDSN